MNDCQSGNWVGSIPSGWSSVPLGAISHRHQQKNVGVVERNLLSLSYGNIITKNFKTTDGLLPASFEGYNIVQKGDVVLRLTDLQNDHTSLRTGIVNEEKGIITSAYLTLRVNDTNTILPEFLHFYLFAFDICKGFYGMGSGVRQSIGFQELSALPVIYPDIAEQQAIIQSIKKRVIKVDELIQKSKETIDVLGRYLISAISRYVVLGDSTCLINTVNPFYQQIDKRRSIARIKDVVLGMSDGTHGTYSRTSDGDLLLSAKNVFEDGIHVSDSESKISHSDYLSIVSNGFPKKDDVLMCCVGTVGRSCVFNDEKPIAFQRSVSFLRPNQRIIMPKMLNYCLQVCGVKNQEQISINKSAQAGLYQHAVENLWIVFPKRLSDQAELVNKLDQISKLIRDEIKSKNELITTLTEYRNSYFYEHITGQRRTR